MIAGTGSGCGKTTVSCALLSALRRRGTSVAAFKCGPDYIDPMFHGEVLGIPSANLDLFLCGEKSARSLFALNSRNRDLSLVEGVMGFYDGTGNDSSENSSFDISSRLDIPAVLVVGCRGASLSVVAQIHGYLSFRPNRIKGVILNHVREERYASYRKMIETHLNIKVLGFLPPLPETSIASRHLGLVTAAEISDLKQKTDALGAAAEKFIAIDELLDLAGEAPPFEFDDAEVKPAAKVKIAVARDNAFCFHYEDGLRLLEKLGAELMFFSPLSDQRLPDGTSGIILCGGYPELYLEKLSSNQLMLHSIRSAHEKGMPVYAECGGYMYLGESIGNFPMTGILPVRSEMTNRLQNFGYCTVTAKRDSFLLKQGGSFPAHEFHYSVSRGEGNGFVMEKEDGRTWEGGFSEGNVFALYAHMHLCGNIELAAKLVRTCEEYLNAKTD